MISLRSMTTKMYHTSKVKGTSLKLTERRKEKDSLISDRNISAKLQSLEVQVKGLEKGMGVMVKAVKEIKIQEIIKTQKNVEELIAAITLIQ